MRFCNRKNAATRVVPVLLLLGLLADVAAAFTHDPPSADYLFASSLSFPKQEPEKIFYATTNTANFTYFGNIADETVTNGVLQFSMTADQATLGWGNYQGNQAPTNVQALWQQAIGVVLRLKQNCPESKWTVFFWRDGERLTRTNRVTVSSTNWTEVSFGSLSVAGARADGLEFSIEGTNGAVMQVEWVKLTQPLYEGYCRREFVVPTGTIWRAVANVGGCNEGVYGSVVNGTLYVNGQVVPRQPSYYHYHTRGVDLSPYLQPGTNCVAFYGRRVSSMPFLYLQSRIIMEDGSVVPVATDTNWTYSVASTSGWCEAGFDDSAWNCTSVGTSVAITTRNGIRQVAIPAYTGRLMMKNPWRRDLFYEGSSNVLVDVYMPRGLTNQAPTLHYAFGLASTNGLTATNLTGSVSSYSIVGTSAVYRIDLGTHSNGVYTLALSLKDGAAVIEERPREPLVILRRMNLTEVQGTNFIEGLTLELEDEIDFTDPNDPHPWFESAPGGSFYGTPGLTIENPRIISTNGLVYREVTFPYRMSGYSYRIEFEHPGSFYYIELEYPDNAKRVIEVCISSKHEKIWTNCQTGYGAETGGRFLPTWTMRKLRVIHVADNGPHSIDIINCKDERAAAKSVKIYRIVGDLPSVASAMQRRYGIHTERSYYTSGIGMNFGVDQPFNATLREQWDENTTLMQRRIKDLVWLMQTTRRYTQYLKFSGQNCHVMGCIQYSEYNTPYAPLAHTDDTSVEQCMKTMLANTLDVNGIDFYSGIEWSQFKSVRTFVNNAQVAQGADTIWMVDRNGEQYYGHDITTVVPNWLHPKVLNAYTNLILDLSNTFGHLGHYKGMHNQIGPMQRMGYWIPAFGNSTDYDDPLYLSFDDISMALFTNDTGVAVPGEASDPDRFAKRADFFSTNETAQSTFFNWRCEKVRDFYTDAVQMFKDKRSDLEIAHALEVEDHPFFEWYHDTTDKTFDEIMKEFAVDVGMLEGVDGLWVGRWTLSWRQGYPVCPSQDPYCWLARTSPDIISTFGHGTNRYVMARTSWDENMFFSAGYAMEEKNDHDILVESDWIMNGCKIRALPQAGGYHCREALIDGLITADARMLLSGFTDININVGHEQMLRSVMKPFTYLPPEKFTPALETGITNNMAIRRLTKDAASWFYVVNPCQWHVSGTIEIETDGTIRELVSSNQVAQGDTSLAVALEPFGLAAYHVDSTNLTIVSYTNDMMDLVELDRLEAIPDRVEEQLNDPWVLNALTTDDISYTTNALVRIRDAMDDMEYALAWSVITEPEFWTLWKWPELSPRLYTSGYHWLGNGTNNHWDTFGNWSKAGAPDADDPIYLDDYGEDRPQVIYVPTNVTIRSFTMQGATEHRSYTFNGSNIVVTYTSMNNLSENGQSLTLNNRLIYQGSSSLSFYCADRAEIALLGGLSSAGPVLLNAQNATSHRCTFRLGGPGEMTYTGVRGAGGISEVVLLHTNALGDAGSGYLKVYECASVRLSLGTDCTLYDYFESQISNCVLRVYEGDQDRSLEVRGDLRGYPSGGGRLVLGAAGNGGSGSVILRVKPDSTATCYLPVETIAGSVVELEAVSGAITVTEHSSYGSGVISGGGVLRKLGGETVQIHTPQVYTGGTQIEAGRVQLYADYGGGLPDTGTVRVDAGAVLDLYERNDTIGVLAGEGTVELDDQTLTLSQGLRPGAPGEVAGTLTVAEAGSLVLGTGSTNVFELGALSGSNDVVRFSSGSGDLTLGGELSIVNTGNLEVGSYTLFDLAGGTISGSFASTNLPSGFSGTVQTGSGDVVLIISAVATQFFLDVETTLGGSAAPSDGWYTTGSDVSVTATADTGYHFIGWTGDMPAEQTNNAVITVNMNRERTVTAVFGIDHYTITACSGAHGTIRPAGAVDVTHGSTNVFVMSPSEGYAVSNVVVDAVSVGATNSYTFEATSTNHSIEVSFQPESPVSLVVVSAEGDPQPGVGTHTYPTNTVLTCWIPDDTLYEGSQQTQYVYTDWTGTGSVASNGTDMGTGPLALTNDSSIAWHWQTNYWLDVQIIDHTVGHRGGTGSVDVTDGWYGAQTNLVLTATEKGGSTFLHWTRDGQVYSTNNPVSLTLDAARTVGANFTNGYPRYYITVSYGAHGQITPTGVVEVAEGFDTNFCITPDAHYHVEDVVMDGISVGPKSTYTFVNVWDDHTLYAEFEMDTYSLEVSSSAGGSVSVPGEGTFTYDYGTAVPITAVAGEQQSFTNWTGSAVTAGKVADAQDPTTSVTMDANYTLQANFLPAENVIPFQEPFEEYDSAVSVVGTNGWYAQFCAAAEESATVSNMSYSFSACDLPLPSETHTNVLCFDMKRSYLTNRVAEASHTNVTIDMMVRWVRPDEQQEEDVRKGIEDRGDDSQFAFYVNTNGYLAVFHGEHLDGNLYTNRFTTLTNVTDSIGTSEWVRLTVTTDYLSDETMSRKFFKVQLNGGVPVGHAEAYLAPTATSSEPGGVWFLCANQTTAADHVSSVQAHGNGYLDDLRVSVTNPLTTGYWVIQPSSDPGGAVTPSAPQAVEEGEDSVQFVITNAAGYEVTNVLIDGSTFIGPTNTYTFGNVQTNHTIRVLTSADLCELEVVSAYGAASPATGTHVQEVGDSLQCVVWGSPHTQGTTQHVCTGWTGTGSAPGSGSGLDTGSFTITNDTSVTWQWQTNMWLDTGTDGHGTVDTADAWHGVGTTVVVQASASSGYDFLAWSGDTNGCTITGAQISVVMDRARSVTATFEVENARHLTVGSAHGAPDPAVGTHTHPSGTVHQCSVSGSPDYVGASATQHVCSGWVGTGSAPASGATTNTGSFTLNEDSSVGWQWQTNYWVSTRVADLTPGGGGGTGEVSVSEGWYGAQTNLQVEAVTKGDSAFEYWLLNGNFVSNSYDNPLSLTLDRPYELTAAFVGGTRLWPITASAGIHGTISPTGVVEVMQGYGTSFVVNAYAHYHIDDIVIDGASTGSTNEYTFENVQTSHTIHAVFEVDPHVLQVSSTVGGSVSVPGEGSFTNGYGSDISLTAVSQERYYFTNWTGSAVDAGMVADPYAASTILTLETDCTVRANFEYKGNLVPFSDSFEIYDAGYHVIGTNGWYCPSPQAASAVSLGYTFTTRPLPLLDAAHTQVMDLDAQAVFVTNKVDPASHTNVTIDMMVRFEPNREDSLKEMIGGHADAQLAVFINSNGYPVVYHGESLGDGAYTNRFTTLTHGVDALESNAWSRVTVTMDYLSDQGSSLKFFKLQMNGGDAVTNDLAYLDPADPGSGTGGCWFLCANVQNVHAYLSTIAFQGEGYVDDLRVDLTNALSFDYWTVTPSAELGGVVTPSVVQWVLDGDDSPEFVITNTQNYEVTNVLIDGTTLIGPTNVYTFTDVQTNHTLHVLTSAEFCNLVVSSPYGSPSPGRGTNVVEVDSFVQCTLSDSPHTDGTTQHVGSGWIGTGCVPASGSGLDTGSFVISNDSTIVWQWMTNYWLDVQIVDHTVGHRGGTGSVDVTDGWYGAQTNLQLTATETGGSTFMHWTRDGVWYSDANPVSLAMDQARTVSAHFTNGYVMYQITASAGPHGAISPSGVVEVAEGFDTNFSITADVRYHVSDVEVDGASIGATNSYAFQNVTSDHTIHALFGIDQHTLTVSASKGGSVVTPGEGDFLYDYGSDADLVAGAVPPYIFQQWTGTAVDAGKVAQPSSATTTVSVVSDYTVKAVFEGTGNTIPFSDPFEAYAVGQSVLDTNGWYGDDPQMAIVSNISYGFYECPLPLFDEDHTDVLVLNTEAVYLTNKVEQASHTNVTVDMMVRLDDRGASDTESMIASESDTQFSVYVNSNGYPVVFHSEDLGGGTYTNRFTVLTQGVDAMETGEWARVTVTMDYLSDQGSDLKFFKVQVNGGEPPTNALAYLDPADPGAGTGGCWFLCANVENVNNYMSAVQFYGHGLVDDLHVDTTNPLSEVFWKVTPSGKTGAEITPSHPVFVRDGHDSPTFVIGSTSGYLVTNVLLDGTTYVGPTNSYIFTSVGTNHTIEVLTEAGYDLDVTSDQGVPVPSVGLHTYYSNSVQTCSMSASPVYGGSQTQYVCTGWAGAGSVPAAGTTTNTGSFTLTNHSAIVWQWVTNYWLDVQIVDHTVGHRGGTGSVDVTDGWYGAQTNLVLTATEEGGSTFMHWTRGGVWYSDANPVSLAMDEARAVAAHFTNGYVMYEITASAGPHGTISPSGVVEVAEGFDTNFSITADAHYHVSDVEVDGASIGATNSHTFQNVTNDHTIHATFSIDRHTLSVSASGPGSVTAPGEGQYEEDYGTEVSLTAEAIAGCYFTNWTGTAVDAGKVADSGAAATTVSVEGDYTVQANFVPGENTIPFSEPFDEYEAGQSVLYTNGWHGPDPDMALVTNMGYTFTACDLPLPAETHTNVLLLDVKDDFVTNRVKQASQTNVVVDMMVQMVGTMEEDRTRERATGKADTQFAVYLNEDGYPVVYHSKHLGGSSFTNCFTTLTNGVDAIGTGEWVRLTITTDYLSDQSNSLKFFEVQLNGAAPLLHALAYVDPAVPGAGTNGPWFVCANVSSVNEHLSSIDLHGEGYVDDLHVDVTNALPATYWRITPSAETGGVITPSGLTLVFEGEDSPQFVITNSSGYVVTNVLKDGTEYLGVTNVYTFYNVTTNHTLLVMAAVEDGGQSSAEAMQTLAGWLTSHGLVDEQADPDRDGMSSWQEYVAGTDPTNGEACLAIEDFFLSRTPQGVVLSWATVRGRIYSVYTSDKPGAEWTNAVYELDGTDASVTYTNIDTTGGVRFYRIGVRLKEADE